MRLAVRVKAAAKRDVVGGRWNGALREAVVVSVRAPAVGEANAAVCRVPAAALRTGARDEAVGKGQRSRDRLAELPGGSGIARRVAELLESGVETPGSG